MVTMSDRYRQAAALSPARIRTLMRNRRIDPVWTGAGDSFWYKRRDRDGEQFVLVDPETPSRTVASSAAELGIDDTARTSESDVLRGPDERGLIRRENDLWLVDANGEAQLTFDGEPDFAWGAISSDTNMVVPFRRKGVELPPMGTVHSPSGRRVITMRPDERQMSIKYMTENVAPSGRARPEVHSWRVQLEDEGPPPESECRIIDLDTGEWVRVDAADGLVSQLSTNGSTEVTWSSDETRLYMLHHHQGQSRASLVEVDTRTGERRDALVIENEPLYEPNQFLYNLPLVRVLPEHSEAVILSQHDGWGHLYLYDLNTGLEKNRVSEGDLVVRDILHLDTEQREITFVAGTSEDGGNPYWRRVYRAGLDGGTQRLLTPEPADHELVAPAPQFFDLAFGHGNAPVRSISPSGRFFVDHQSTVSDPPVILLRDANDGGRVVLELERTDIGPLLESGYVVPQSFCVKADDGVTDLWGILSMPNDPLDPAHIPVIEDVYGGYQIAHSPHAFIGASMMASRHVYLSAYNALGFAAVMLDGRGTPGRERAFRQGTFRRSHTEAGLEDHVTAIAALAASDPRLDLARVGVIGHSYGGYNAARMLLMFPDFYRAAVSSAGVHVAKKVRHGMWDWHIGGSTDRDSDRYTHLGNIHLVDRLSGDLLIACGEIDENATVDHSYALADALIRAGKRFDFKIWPGVDHYDRSPYASMVYWDHFVRSLLGQRPPVDYVPIGP